MKEIRAYIQPHKLSHITMALIKIPGFPGMTVSECEGFGRERTEHSQDYKPYLSKKRIEIFAPESLVDTIFETIMTIAYSGQHGDGKVYVVDTIKGGRVSTKEVDTDLG